jgi:ribonuclease HI
MISEIKIFTDGGSRGNPGPAAIGVYIADGEGKDLFRTGAQIGHDTNNTAEYKAVLEALRWLLENVEDIAKDAKISFFMDSQLVRSQITGLFKVKNANLRNLLFEVREKEAQIKRNIFYNYIPREQNKIADSLVNASLDNNL